MIGFNIGSNIVKGKISTWLGVFTIMGSVISVFAAGRDWTDAAIGIGAGVGLIGLVKK